MNKKLRNALILAGLLSIITLSQTNADDRVIMTGDGTVGGLSGITTTDSGHGGAVQNYNNDLTINGNFSNNSLTSSSGVILGGAIYQSGGNLTINDGTIFSNNIVTSPNQTYPDAGWDGVDSASGGAIFITAAETVTGNGTISFEGNIAQAVNASDESNGGALHFEGVGNVTFENVNFSENSSNTRGGAIYNGDSNITITGTGTFENNSSGSGGAIYSLDTTGNTVTTTGTNSSFTENTASKNGGAVANFGGTVNVGENNSFTGNETAVNGGAIYNSNYTNTGSVNIDGGTTFTDNSAQNGGAIYNSGSITMDTSNGDITFSGNTASSGSDLYLDGSNSIVTIKGNNSDNKVSFASGSGAIAGAGSIINESAGTVEFVNNKDISNFTGNYTQTNGTTSLNNSDMFNKFDIQDGALEILNGSTAVIDGADRKFNGTSITVSGTNSNNEGSILDIGTAASAASIADTVQVTVNDNGTINLNNGSLTLNSNDTWGADGTIHLNGGNLNFNGTSDGTNGILKGDSGRISTSSGSSLNIGEESYIGNGVTTDIHGELAITGDVNLNSGDTITGDITINNNGVLNLGDNVTMAETGQTITLGGADSEMNLNGTNNLDIKADITGASGEINKEGSGNVTFSGTTVNYNGSLTVNNSGNLTFTDADGFGGNLIFGDIEGKSIGIISDTIIGSTTLDKDAQITFSTYRDVDLQFNDSVSVSQGTITAQAKDGQDVIFNNTAQASGDGELDAIGKNVIFTNGATADNAGTIGVKATEEAVMNDVTASSDSIIGTIAGNTTFNNLSLSNSDLYIMQNGFSAQSTTIDGSSSFNLMNGTITDNDIGSTTFNSDGSTGNFTVDVSARDWDSDTFITNAIAGNGTLNVSDFQFINKCPIDRHIALKIFNYDPAALQGNVTFTATDKEIFTPIGYYRLFSQGGGNYTASLTRYNPQVFRGQVATVAMYQNQLVVNNVLFDHVQEVNMQYLTQQNPNKYAAAYPQFAPYQYNKKDGSLWFKAFGTFEKLGMTQGLNVNNNFYGALVGADFPAIELKHGWTLLPTAYVGYMGAHQTFANMSMYQNGGQLGGMATFMKNDFIGSILAYGGGYGNDMDVAGYTDHTGNWFAGTAAKIAYNFHPSKHFVIQPTLLASYNAFGDQRWHTDFGDMSMRSRMLNGVNIAPGINFIYGRETWSIYATVQYFYNILGYSNGRAGNVNLPGVEMRHGFLEYGIGVTKNWKDRFSGYLQVVLRNGGRTGIGFQGGLMYRL